MNWFRISNEKVAVFHKVLCEVCGILRAMKIVMCLECGDMFSPGFVKVKHCECGYTFGKWQNPSAGTLDVYSKVGTGHLLILGINNDFITLAGKCKSDEDWKEGTAKILDACPGYLFHRNRRNSPVVLVRPGESSDVFFEAELFHQWKAENVTQQ